MNELLGSKYQEFDAPLAVEGVRVEDALVLLPPALHPHGNVTSKHAGTFTRGRVHRITSQLHDKVRRARFESAHREEERSCRLGERAPFGVGSAYAPEVFPLAGSRTRAPRPAPLLGSHRSRAPSSFILLAPSHQKAPSFHRRDTRPSILPWPTHVR